MGQMAAGAGLFGNRRMNMAAGEIPLVMTGHAAFRHGDGWEKNLDQRQGGQQQQQAEDMGKHFLVISLPAVDWRRKHAGGG